MRDYAMRLVPVGALTLGTGFWGSVFFSLNLWNTTPWPHQHAWWEKGASVLLFVVSMVLLSKGQQLLSPDISPIRPFFVVTWLLYQLLQVVRNANWNLTQVPPNWWESLVYPGAIIAGWLFGRYLNRKLAARLAPPLDATP